MISILGGSGYVGKAFADILTKRGQDHQVIARDQIDYTDTAELIGYLQSAKPSFLVNCAGYTGKPNVDACEKDKAATLQGNAVLPGNIQTACRTIGIPWGHVSSGCIFSGRRSDGQGFAESDIPNFSFRQSPCSWYSGTKALGEETLGYMNDNGVWKHENDPDCYIWRLRIPFDNVDSPRNYLTKLMRYDKLLVAENSVSELTEFAHSCLACWEKRVPFGIYNVTNPGAVDTKQVVDLIKKSGVSDKDFQFFENDKSFYSTAAATPRSNCVLDPSKLANVGIHMTSVEEAIEQALKNWES